MIYWQDPCFVPSAMRGLLPSIGFLVLFIVAVWAVGRLLGYHVSLWATLVASIFLTVILNLALTLFRKV
ncbi:MAG: hypothetical protein R3338_02535 [Thermoanaerobaculia bacterium]|nr:hypothetical protein [Thermoanaerobaculia bacterium]